MKILNVYYTHKPGGFCKRLYRLLNALSAQGSEVTYVTLDMPPSGKLANSVNIKMAPFPITSRNGIFFWSIFIVWMPIYVAIFAKKLGPDRLVAFNPFYSCILFPAKLLTRAKTILFVRSLVFEINRLTKKPWIMQILSNQIDRIGCLAADSIVCMTQTMQRRLGTFIGRSLESMPLLPNNLELTLSASRYSPSSQPPLVVITSGVLDQRKNVELVLQAIKVINSKNISLKIAGDGPLKEQLQKMSAKLELANVEFLGWCDSLDNILNTAHLYVHPSLHEGMSNSLLEAMGCGLPILASKTEEQTEIINDELLLFSPTDPNDLASRLKNCLDSKTYLDQLKMHTVKISDSLRFKWEERALDLVLSD